MSDPAGRYRQDARPARPREADGGCIACGGSGHSYRVCVLLGAALHRKLGPHKDMKDVVDVILRLLLWDWKETRVDGGIDCLSYASSRDVIAAGSQSGEIFFIDAQTGEKLLCPVQVDAGSGHFGGGVQCVTFNGTGDTIVAGCGNGNIFFIDTATSQVREPPLRVDGVVSSLDISPCGTKIAATSNNHYHDKYEIKMFNLNLRSGDWEIQSESTLRGHRYVPSLSREFFLSHF